MFNNFYRFIILWSKARTTVVHCIANIDIYFQTTKFYRVYYTMQVEVIRKKIDTDWGAKQYQVTT